MLRLTTARHLELGRNPEFPPYDGLAAFFAERCAPYGVHVDTEQALPGNHNSYPYLVTQALAALNVPAAPPPDLVVIAHALPDCDLATSVAGHVQQLLTGQPMVFAVTDQGRTTAFAALRAAGALARGGGYQRIAVLALDQGTIAYRDPALADLDPSTDHAVGMLFTAEGLAELTALRTLPEVEPDQVGTVLATELAKIAPSAWPEDQGPVRSPFRPAEPVLILGHGPRTGRLADELPDPGELPGPWRVRQAAPGRICTRVWTELAAELAAAPDQRKDRLTVVAEYDQELRYLALVSFNLRAVADPPGQGAPS
ncbi:hypothetical protein [Actinospica robiniae]|uniref:hypothetical protein n=1 Tax=Actinospica robiniae TaxID=304901 RepID=UPI00041D18FB|nr:hypothetical protein [Actinospica robiniae]